MGWAVGGKQFPEVEIFLLFRIMSGYVTHEFCFRWVSGSVTEDKTANFVHPHTEVKTVQICL